MITLIQPVSFDGFLPPYAFLRLWSDEQFDPVSTLFPIGCEVPDRAATSAFHFEVVTTPFQSLFRSELYDTRESLMFIDISSFTSHFQISDLPWCESKWSGKSQCSFHALFLEAYSHHGYEAPDVCILTDILQTFSFLKPLPKKLLLDFSSFFAYNFAAHEIGKGLIEVYFFQREKKREKQFENSACDFSFALSF